MPTSAAKQQTTDIKGQLGLNRPVRLTIPASVAYDLKSLQKGLATFAERLGCRPCFSGVECTFQIERDFVINDKLEINRVAGPGSSVKASDPDGDPVRKVSVPVKLSYNIKQIQELAASIAERLGHAQCFSGFDILFGQEREFVVNPSGKIGAGIGV